MHKGWNVHAYTRDLLGQLQEVPFFGRIDQREAHACLAEIRAATSPACRLALDKIKQRYKAQNGGYFDPQLRNLNIILLLRTLFREIRHVDDPSMWNLFEQALIDTGNTCAQGDSHRLALLYIALMRSMEDAPEQMRSQPPS